MFKKGKTKEGIEIEIIYSEKAKKQMITEGKLTDLEMIITDKNQEQYQANVTLWQGWSFADLQEIVKESMLLCDASVIAVKATFMGSPVLN
jgi:hypothetical protein